MVVMRGNRPVRGFALGSDSEDVEAIQRMLGPTSTQISATVATCGSLDVATKNQWYATAQRVVSFVSGPADGDKLAIARELRTDVNAFMKVLKDKGCGNAPAIVGGAPVETQAPPPNDPQRNPLDWFAAHKTGLIVGGAVVGGVIVLGVLAPYANLLTAAVSRR
jgi:hypothetical protein